MKLLLLAAIPMLNFNLGIEQLEPPKVVTFLMEHVGDQPVELEPHEFKDNKMPEYMKWHSDWRP